MRAAVVSDLTCQTNARFDFWSCVELTLFACFVFLSPFHIFSISKITPATCCAAALCAVSLGFRCRSLPIVNLEIVRPLVWFVLWTCAVGLVWAMTLRSVEPMIAPATYLAGTLLFCAIVTLRQRHGPGFDTFAFTILLATIGFQAISAALFGLLDARSSRHCLYFTNPNQLGLFAIVAGASLFLIAEQRRKLLRWCALACLPLAWFLTLSLSRAALLAALMLLVLIPWLFGGRRWLGYSMVVILGCAGVIHVTDSSIAPWAWDLLKAGGDKRFDSLEGRGYDRILNHPGHLVLGAGEGEYSRFVTVLPREMHSTPGTIVFCYGIFGASLFAWFLLRLGRGFGRQTAFALLPLAAYGLTHHALRSPHVWLLFAIVACTRNRGDTPDDKTGAMITTARRLPAEPAC
jgi:hypothetical protein